MTRLRLDPDPWAASTPRFSHSRLQISLGDLERARDHLTFRPRPTERANNPQRVRRTSGSNRSRIWKRSKRRFTGSSGSRGTRRGLDARSLTWVAHAIVSLDSRGERASRALHGRRAVLTSGYDDALVIACRAQPELARRIVADGTHRDALRAVLLRSEGRAARTSRRTRHTEDNATSGMLCHRARLRGVRAHDAGANEPGDRQKSLYQ